MADEQHFPKLFRRGHIQRFPDEIGDFHDGNFTQFRVMGSQIVQPVVAGGQDQAAALQCGLVDLELQ